MRIVALASQKGGCGKTTTSIHLAACLAHLKKKVLIVDMDPQGHSTCGLGIHAEKLRFTLYDLLKLNTEPRPSLSEVILPLGKHLSILPASTNLACLEEELARMARREKRLGEIVCSFLEKEDWFDCLILDCPPNLGVLTYNALEAADEVIIPIEPSFFSLHGLAKMTETIEGVNKRRKVPLVIHALMTLFNEKNRFSLEVREEVRRHFKDRLFKTAIHEDGALKEAAGAGKHIVEFAPESRAFHDYTALSREFLEREWGVLCPLFELSWWNLVQSLPGPRKTFGGVLFQLAKSGASSVEIAGDFNRWIPEKMIKRENDLWQKIIPVKAGEFRYKFIVDGEWQLDASHPVVKENSFGTLDSYLKVV